MSVHENWVHNLHKLNKNRNANFWAKTGEHLHLNTCVGAVPPTTIAAEKVLKILPVKSHILPMKWHKVTLTVHYELALCSLLMN